MKIKVLAAALLAISSVFAKSDDRQLTKPFGHYMDLVVKHAQNSKTRVANLENELKEMEHRFALLEKQLQETEEELAKISHKNTEELKANF